jgi:signal transduction histidine kinase
LMLDEIERLLIEVKGVTDALAHDLRTPLTHLRLQLCHMREQADAPMQSSLDGALHELDGLLRRFRGLLRISEIERRQRRSGFVMIDPCDMFNQIAELFDPLAEEKSVTLDVHCEPNHHIFADGDLLFEAICNLVDNAIKFTPAGGSVTVQFSEVKGIPLIEVIDTGCGVAADERAAIMKRLNSHNHEPDQVGRGLGHSIIAAVLNLHGFALKFAERKTGTHIAISCLTAATIN